MMRLLSTVSVLFLAASTFAQGTVSFSNRTSLGDWKVALIGEVPAGLSPSPIAVNIFLADPSGLGPTGSSLASTSFRNSSAAAAFFVTSIDEIDVNTLAPGTSAQKFIAQLLVPTSTPSGLVW
jgi:hypothetical protein